MLLLPDLSDLCPYFSFTNDNGAYLWEQQILFKKGAVAKVIEKSPEQRPLFMRF